MMQEGIIAKRKGDVKGKTQKYRKQSCVAWQASCDISGMP